VRTTALPINSARASPYSLKILDARRVTDGIARRPCSASHRRLNDEFFSYAPQHDYGARCSNFRSRSICALSLSGWSGSGFSASRNFSAIALAMARLCLWSRSLRRGTTNLLPAPSAASPPASTAALLKEPETAAFGYLRERLYSEQRVAPATFGYPATCAVLVPASGDLIVFLKPLRCFRSPISSRRAVPFGHGIQGVPTMGRSTERTALETISESVGLFMGR
jgi:hypothetical protein